MTSFSSFLDDDASDSASVHSPTVCVLGPRRAKSHLCQTISRRSSRMESIFFSSKNARKSASPAAPDGAKQNKLGPLRHWTCEPGSTGVGLLLQIHRSLGVAIFLRVPESDGSRAGEILVLERTLPAWTFRNTSSSSSAARRTTCQPAHFYRRVRGAYSPTPPCFADAAAPL